MSRIGVGNPLYSVIENLCKDKGVGVCQMCNDLGFRNSLISDLKHGRSKTLSMQSIWKIAQYFGVSVDVFFEAAEDLRVSES